MRLLVAILIAVSFIPVFSQSIISFDVDTTQFTPGEIVELDGKIDSGLEGQLVSIEVQDGGGNVILIRTVTTEKNGEFSLKFKIPENAEPGKFDIVTNMEIDGDAFSETKTIESSSKKGVTLESEEIEVDLMTYFPYLGIIIAVIVGIIIGIKIKNSKKDDDFSDDEYEDDAILETASLTPKFQDMQTGSQLDSAADFEPHQIIEKKLQMISKLQENKIGDHEKLEEIKKSLINDGSFSQADNDYLEEKYNEYKNSESKNEN